MAFDLSNAPTPSSRDLLPPELLKIHAESLARFEQRMGGFLRLPGGHAWREDYEAEILRVIQEASKEGVLQAVALLERFESEPLRITSPLEFARFLAKILRGTVAPTP